MYNTISLVRPMQYRYYNNPFPYAGTDTLSPCIQIEYYNFPSAFNYLKEYERYDYVFMHNGPFSTHIYPNTIQVAMFAQQNTMRKHDFLTYIDFVSSLRLMPFVDVFTKQLCNTSHPNSHQNMESATQNSFIGGGKVPHEKNTKTHITRGSKFFEGGLISHTLALQYKMEVCAPSYVLIK